MRPLKITAELRDSFVLLLEAGNYVETVCEALRVSRRVFYDWMERGEREEEEGVESPFVDFREAVLQAKAKAEISALAVVFNAKETNWQAAAWYLERTRQKRYGRQVVVEEKKSKIKTLAEIASDRKKAKGA